MANRSTAAAAGDAWSLLGAAVADIFDIAPPRTTAELEGLVNRLLASSSLNLDATPQAE